MEYFAFVDSIETLDNGRTIIQFDSIKVNQIEDFLGKKELTYQETESLKPLMVYCDYSSEEYRSFSAEVGEVRENTWVIIKLTYRKGEYPVRAYRQDYEESRIPFRVLYFEKKGCNTIDKDTEKYLKALFRITETDHELERLIKQKKLEHLSGRIPKTDTSEFDVAVYNVGQGNMNAILDNSGIPVAYFDVGGGSFRNSHTYLPKSRKKLCFKKATFIILSHWDSDHWWTYYWLLRNYPDDVNPQPKWIVPDQDLGPFQYGFYKLLKEKGHQILVCTKKVKCSFDFGDIEVGTGGSKNDSGIVLKAKIGSLKFLLPGDASYDAISPKPNKQYDGIVASHHGGKSTDNISDFPIPMFADKGKIVYSYGTNNSYNHPSLNSVAKHGRVSWLNIKETTNGSVSFTATNTRKAPCNGICNGKCNLDIEQVF